MTIARDDLPKDQKTLDELWEKKKDLIHEFYQKHPERAIKSPRMKGLKDNCKWCDKLKEAYFRHCLYCGTVFRK